MSMSEVEFVFFLPLILAAYWLLPRRVTLQNLFLLLASYTFFASWNPRLLLVLVASTALDHAVARVLGPAGEGEPESPARSRRRRVALGFGLAVNLGVLGYFKYEEFFATSLNALLARLGLPEALPVLRVVAPIGISFWTLQKIAYLLDVYDGRIPACRSFLVYANFVAFFPQLLAGPIPRAGRMIPQFEAARRPRPDAFASGSGAFLLGLFMKVLVADALGPKVVSPVFANPAAHDAAAHWGALAGFALQVFCDFAGYSAMAVGVGRLLGLDLPQNFDYPFLSRSLPEFWRRWHITLNTFLFDYIYGPMTTGRGFMRGRLDLGFVIVFLVSGLWHGAMWTFVAWGLLHGLGLVVHHRWDSFYKGLCRRDRVWVARRKSAAYAAGAWTLTQGFFLLSLVPFRAPSLTSAAQFSHGLAGGGGGDSISRGGALLLAFCLLLVAAYHLLSLRPFSRAWDAFLALPAPVRGVAYGLVIVFLLLFAPVGSGTFIYAQF